MIQFSVLLKGAQDEQTPLMPVRAMIPSHLTGLTAIYMEKKVMILSQ